MDEQRIGPYVIEAEIGSGGMGTVYRAHHGETGELAAVKVLPPALARQEGFVLRFSREVEALERLNSPQIVRLLSSGVENGTYYFAMEYVTGETLSQRLLRDRRLPWRDAVAVAIQLCAALKAAHDTGVIHRDLKPSNVLLSDGGGVKLTDFGVAQLFAAEKLTATGGVVGTAEYMSPEQALGQRVTKRSDLYSLGAVLYVMLTGRPPFVGENSIDVLQKHRYGQFDLPSRYAPEIPSWLDDVVGMLLEKNPDNRLPDAHVATRRLQEVVKKVDLRQGRDETAVAAERPRATTLKGLSDSEGSARSLAQPGREAEQHGGGTFSNNTTVLVVLLLALLAVVWWMWPRALTPEQHFARANAVLEQPPGPEWIDAAEEHLRPLLQADPERWGPQVKPLLEEVELYELEQQIAPPRRRGRRPPPQSEPQRLLSDVKRLWDAGQLTAAEQKLLAVETLVAGNADEELLQKLIDRWKPALAEAIAQSPPAAEYVRQALERAEELATSDPAAARAIWNSLIVLYADEPAAADGVAEARRRLQE